EDAVIVNAAGSLPGDLHRLWRTRTLGGYHMEYGFSCMGYEVAGALGVKWAEPHRPVYALVGDGSYLMLHSELVTSLREHTKITVIVFDNGGFRSIQNLQTSHGFAPYGNEFRQRDNHSRQLTGPHWGMNFAEAARGLGAVGLTADSPDTLMAALAEARLAERTVVIDLKIHPGQETTGYDTWWRVGVPEVPESPDYADNLKQLNRARPW
ncbi:MAG: thiamine pyrophosphate-dependent enzyme, partial [Sulfobacillus sp.]|nr:thiamine pyrophosphate-dependent enzyme [Sulfobacillus sp.]